MTTDKTPGAMVLACPFCGMYPDIFSDGDATCATEMCPGYDISCTQQDWNKRAAPVDHIEDARAMVEQTPADRNRKALELLGQARSMVNGASDEWHKSVAEVLGND